MIYEKRRTESYQEYLDYLCERYCRDPFSDISYDIAIGKGYYREQLYCEDYCQRLGPDYGVGKSYCTGYCKEIERQRENNETIFTKPDMNYKKKGTTTAKPCDSRDKEQKKEEPHNKEQKEEESHDKGEKGEVTHDKEQKGEEAHYKEQKGEESHDEEQKGEESHEKEQKEEESHEKEQKEEESHDKEQKGEESHDKEQKGKESSREEKQNVEMVSGKYSCVIACDLDKLDRCRVACQEMYLNRIILGSMLYNFTKGCESPLDLQFKFETILIFE